MRRTLFLEKHNTLSPWHFNKSNLTLYFSHFITFIFQYMHACVCHAIFRYVINHCIDGFLPVFLDEYYYLLLFVFVFVCPYIRTMKDTTLVSIQTWKFQRLQRWRTVISYMESRILIRISIIFPFLFLRKI